MNKIAKALANLRKLEEINPFMVEQVKKGYQIGAYDAETHMVITKELKGDELLMQVIEAGYFIPFGDAHATVSDLVILAHDNSIHKGWHDDSRSFGEDIALMHSELSEALEDFRNGKAVTEIWLEDEKPCGIPTELADTVIRILDVCGLYGIDLGAAIAQKMAYNATRPARHGGKVL